MSIEAFQTVGTDASLADAVLAAVQSVLGPAEQAVPLHEPEFAGREWDYVKDCIDTGWVSSAGVYEDRFESDLAAVTGAKHAVAVVNGTAALHLALLLVGVRPGDEVQPGHRHPPQGGRQGGGGGRVPEDHDGHGVRQRVPEWWRGR